VNQNGTEKGKGNNSGHSATTVIRHSWRENVTAVSETETSFMAGKCDIMKSMGDG
jgi:hypothetical protein